MYAKTKELGPVGRRAPGTPPPPDPPMMTINLSRSMIVFVFKRDHKQSLITKSFRPRVVHDVYKQNFSTPVKHAHYRGQACHMSDWSSR